MDSREFHPQSLETSAICCSHYRARTLFISAPKMLLSIEQEFMLNTVKQKKKMDLIQVGSELIILRNMFTHTMLLTFCAEDMDYRNYRTCSTWYASSCMAWRVWIVRYSKECCFEMKYWKELNADKFKGYMCWCTSMR